MTWEEVRDIYPDRWLVVAVLDPLPVGSPELRPTQLRVVEECRDGSDALARYRRVHAAEPKTVHLFVHTAREELRVGLRMRLLARDTDAA